MLSCQLINIFMYDVILASDHRGYQYKKACYDFLKSLEINHLNENDFSTGKITELPAVNGTERVDYPDIVKLVIDKFTENTFAILFCGSGFGVSMAANRSPLIRAGVARTCEDAKMMRLHNNANCLCIGTDFTTEFDTIQIIRTFFYTDFMGEHHIYRVNKLKTILNN